MRVCTIAQKLVQNNERQPWLIARAGVFLLLTFALLVNSIAVTAQILTTDRQQAFAQLYEAELGATRYCADNTRDEIAFCAVKLKDSGNAPRIFLPHSSSNNSLSSTPKASIVLFHGLGDSPYFVRSIAQSFQSNNYLVITPLNPGHGKKVAAADMQDPLLQKRWISHVNDVMKFAEELGYPVFVGGFSSGGTFATWYGLQHSDKVKGILLFSGALQLSDSAETMSRIWGIKSIARWLDGDYETIGAHPYKYPTIASFSALALVDVIKDVRHYLAENKINKPIFAAHSMADKITMFSGIENLTRSVEGEHMIFKIDAEYDLCHQDLPMSNIQLIGLKFNRTLVNQRERCAVPKANPLHEQMMFMANIFVEQQLATK